MHLPLVTEGTVSMTLSNEPLTKLLEPYPGIRRALSNKWIVSEDQIDPIESSFPLARWLRLDSYKPVLTNLGKVLEMVEIVPGMADRRRRISSNGSGFIETVTELYLAAWIRAQGYSFDCPTKGPDFFVHLEDAQRLAIEVTTPRKAAWSDDLFDRLTVVALRTGFSARVDQSMREIPDPGVSQEIVTDIAKGAFEQLILTEHQLSKVRQRVNVGNCEIKIIWTANDDPGITWSMFPGPTTPYSGFQWLCNAARVKAAQLPEQQPGVLALGTNQMPFSWHSFRDSFRLRRPEIEHFDWERLPNQVKYIILYSLDVTQIEPSNAMLIINPASDFPVNPQIDRFIGDMFPIVLQVDPSCDGVTS